MAWQARATRGWSSVKVIAFFIGLVAALLGGLWLLQGIGVVHLRPILCFADCDPVQGLSTTWAVVGALMFIAGGAALFWSWKRRSA
jgi:hypothetical protein